MYYIIYNVRQKSLPSPEVSLLEESGLANIHLGMYTQYKIREILGFLRTATASIQLKAKSFFSKEDYGLLKPYKIAEILSDDESGPYQSIH